MHKNAKRNSSRSKRQDNKQNEGHRDPKRQLAETVKFSRRSSDSVGKIIKNRSRAHSNALVDVTPAKNIPLATVFLQATDSGMKRKKLEEKFKCIVGEYETKQKELDDKMRQFESSHPQKMNFKSGPRQQLPIMATSEFCVLGPEPKHEVPAAAPGSKLRIDELETCKVIAREPTKQHYFRRHATEKGEATSDSEESSCVPLQHTEPESKALFGAEDASVTRFIDAIGKQIDLEAELRKWRNRVNKKIEATVARAIEAEGLPKDILKVDFQEYEVFGRDAVSAQEIIATNIVRCYRKCEHHWKNSLVRRFTKMDLKLAIARLDFDGTGVITPKILARELSIMTNRNLRVRDVYRVCRRISTELNITLPALVNSLRVQ